MNKVFLLGRIGNDPDLKLLSGFNVVQFSLATSKKYKDKNGEKKENTQWHTINAFNKLAELVNKFCTKGDKVLVEGEIQYRVYEKDGVKKTLTNIVASNVTFFESKNRQDNSEPNDNVASKKRDKGGLSTESTEMVREVFENDFDPDELPF